MTATAPRPSSAAATAKDDYTSFCEGIRALTSIDLLQYKRGQMERRIRSFAQRRGESDLTVYLGLLRRDRGELEEFLDRVTINVSQLWRNPEQWTVLEREILPELIARSSAGRVRAWSAGCSYGAEAYTLAALFRQLDQRTRAEIVGTDIDRRMVERAKLGRFSDEDARSASRTVLERWFARDGDEWQASRELRALTRFEVGDLLRVQPRREAYDLVLCRNTVIYFTEDVRDALHERLVTSIRPGGYFVIGSTERVSRPRELGLVSTHPFTYRKS
ncbi:protein-glutamate O-methyltransferase CheR [Conexibacter sp. CPCC 206217]|uniref:CheR family methyltransferase n=1 Tax=Conexibacter sp. CPCC 206217 TaxID=3064574 RepID=UPI002725F5E3|nr:protein-glutamate O-methyltransferase CheR [Conexibacter sp. CPCC 206217]MDO8211403.1 protein-glutamate O-methyltransferase CheR [Conexibacter sp. CPCC 206217]